ncbi:dTDP-4-dehydrorhamnose reductase [Chryseobacterium sp. MFBS3-17]|uniref:dTDP-4-dehydrorhamnose reductase n=1 Tax=Chryseobacterium sp. MFBS3-17 TaxID=2886689 RepID=UPI001D0E7414|nr:dTDP-4-dehydrorhamnose reductase [Chryseobacterium sp. MFBS3-17]MCC2591348.1 dTDP-4-dehydrorhamnose reductase [Chryseobacterium sp. MFBS3-17]
MKKILVTGAGGQLGNCIQKLAASRNLDYHFHFVTSAQLDITDAAAVQELFAEIKPDFCINAAAFTAVDLAEKESEKAFAVNATGAENLAKACAEVKCMLLHVSTDYVFDGETEISYSEDNFTNPASVYGQSKLQGEELALEHHPETVIIRTSWLYSEFNKNFVKTMLALFASREEIGVVGDQYGQPTNANDLAEALMQIIESGVKGYGVFHFSNYPETTWYDFAAKIAEYTRADTKINKITTPEYPTPASRPRRSTLSLDKIEEVYGIESRHWENSLEECLDILAAEK